MDDVTKRTPNVPSGGVGIGGKEKEAISFGLTPVGQEVELPKEVTSAGVSVHPTNIPIPPKVSQMGVTPLGQNIPSQPTSGTITLPLNDEQIVQGMHQSITSSWRWLAQWCRKRLKQFRLWKR